MDDEDHTVKGRASEVATTNKRPTREEIRVIKDASELFKSNSFKLQVCNSCVVTAVYSHRHRSMLYYPTFVQTSLARLL